MSEFKHWLDESSEASDFERAVLRSGLDADPPEPRRDEVWGRVLASISLTPIGAAIDHGATLKPAAAALKGAASGAKAGVVWLGVGKGFVIGLALYGASAGVSEISTRFAVQHARGADHARAEHGSTVTTGGDHGSFMAREAVPVGETPSESSTALAVRNAGAAPGAATIAGVSSAQETTLPARAPDAPSVASFEDSPSSPSKIPEKPASQLEAEARALREARAELKAGQLSDAFATLEASRHELSIPELYQEREALMIELLYRSGQVAAAAERARAFLERFPESPHAGHVRQFAAQR
jgi:hypothetical protein